MSIEITITRPELAKFRKGISQFDREFNSSVRKNIQRAGKEMESVTKLEITGLGLVDTGRMRASMVSQPFDDGYGAQMTADMTKVESPKTGQKSGAKAGVVAVVNYAKFHEERYHFMEKGQRAGVAKFKKLMGK